MVFEFKLPDIGEGVHEGEISRWLVESGQKIEEDQPMVEVMTDKVTVEITSPVSGTVQTLCFNPGSVVKVGSVMITIEQSGASLPPPKVAASAAHREHGGTPTKVAVQEAPSYAIARTSGKVLAAPAVRKLARQMGIDLALVQGTAPHGRVHRADLLAFSTSSAGKTVVPLQKSSTPTERETLVPFIGMRRKIGEHLVKSKHTAPHFTYVEEADMTEIVKFRDDILAEAEARNIKLSYLPFIIKAVIEGLKKYPLLNAVLNESSQEIVLKHYYNIGIAVATPDGLVVPVIRNAQDKSLLELAKEITELGDKARKGKLALTDLQGGTFTLTSIGSIGGIFSAPIINYPEVGIMGIQKIEKRPVVRNDQIVIREMTYFSISCDHRVVDGAEAALFMKEMITWLEHPGRFLVSGLS
jgi:pyruvate dehydrogenase E2 component (dihydrolipoamide acetyltransferase)